MRKEILDLSATGAHVSQRNVAWLDLPQIASIELSSEDPLFPVESVFQDSENTGWRADRDGEQQLRLIFDKPVELHRIQLEFVETENERTQEFTIRWSSAKGEPVREIVRQQWVFNPEGSTREVEDYGVNLKNVSALELSIRPDLQAGHGRATLSKWRLM